MRKTIYLISACDRFNYGDLLFNHILEAALPVSLKAEYRIVQVGVLGRKMSAYGGHDSIGLNRLYRQIQDHDVMIFAGGGLLGHHWDAMLIQYGYGILLRGTRKVIGHRRFENLLRRFFFRDLPEYPFIHSRTGLTKKVSIIYNSVGGGALQGMSPKELNRIKMRLTDSDYLSVRDNHIFKLLETGDNSPALSPDSAILLKEIFPLRQVRKKMSDRGRKIIDSIPYILLHCNVRVAVKHMKRIQELIQVLTTTYDYRILLLPVNYIQNRDLAGLKRISRGGLNGEVLQGYRNIFDICGLIGHARLVLATSLHVNITAASYGVPHLGLTREVKKVNAYFETWYNGLVHDSYHPDRLPPAIAQALADTGILGKNTNRLCRMARNNLAAIFRRIAVIS